MEYKDYLKEYEDFKNDLLKKDSSEILNKSNEITFYKMMLSKIEKKRIAADISLHEMYKQFINNDNIDEIFDRKVESYAVDLNRRIFEERYRKNYLDEVEEFKEKLAKMTPDEILKNSKKILFYNEFSYALKYKSYKTLESTFEGKNSKELCEKFIDYYSESIFMDSVF